MSYQWSGRFAEDHYGFVQTVGYEYPLNLPKGTEPWPESNVITYWAHWSQAMEEAKHEDDNCTHSVNAYTGKCLDCGEQVAPPQTVVPLPRCTEIKPEPKVVDRTMCRHRVDALEGRCIYCGMPLKDILAIRDNFQR